MIRNDNDNEEQQHGSAEHRIGFRNLLPEGDMKEMIRKWLKLDMPTFDVGGYVVGNQTKSAQLFMKSGGMVAGRPFFETVFEVLGDCHVEWNEELYSEGQLVELPQGVGKLCLATVTGPVHKLLQGERTALNTLSRCSGVATAASRAVKTARSNGWSGWVAGTRKTTPGDFRIVEKYGLLVGGAATHRLDLSQMVMLKDNHIWACGGSIASAVEVARRAAGFSSRIEVECQTLEEALIAAEAGADIVMLDNFEPEQLRKDAAMFKQRFPHVLVEASGGITTETMQAYLSDDVDIVSQGKLTHGYGCIDYSLKIVQ